MTDVTHMTWCRMTHSASGASPPLPGQGLNPSFPPDKHEYYRIITTDCGMPGWESVRNTQRSNSVKIFNYYKILHPSLTHQNSPKWVTNINGSTAHTIKVWIIVISGLFGHLAESVGVKYISLYQDEICGCTSCCDCDDGDRIRSELGGEIMTGVML